MSEHNTNGGLLSNPQTKPSSFDAVSKQAGTPSAQSTSQSNGASKSKAARSQRQQKPTSEAEKRQAVTDLLTGKRQNTETPPNEGVQNAAGEGVGPQANGTAGDANQDSHAVRDDGAGSLPGVSGDTTIKDLAEKLGTTPKKLYEDIQITTQAGETLSLGEVKDRIQTQEAATREIVERETAINQRESAMLQNMQLLQSVMGDLEGKLDPQTVQKLQERTVKQEARERQLMIQTMPELADPAQLDTFRTNVAEHMEQYGFRPNELVIRDHRIALAIKDAIQTKRQLQKLMEFQPEQSPPKAHKPQGKRKAPNRNAEVIANARGSKRPQAKAAAVNAILKGASNA